MKSRLLAVAAVLTLTACGGTSSSGGPQTVPSAPQNMKQYAKMTLTWKIGPAGSSSDRAPRYVSPNASAIEVKVNSVNGGVLPSWVPADTTTALNFNAGGNCTSSSGTATCTLQVAAPPGSVNYTFNVFDNASHVLSTFTSSFTIAQGTNNSLSVTLDGVVATVSVSGSTLIANTATPGETLTVTPLDASGAQIVGSAPFASPITLTDNDPSGATKLHVNGGAPAKSVIVNSPADVVTLGYTGQAINSFTISASGTSISGTSTMSTSVNDVTFTGTTLDDAAHGGTASDPNWNLDTVFFSSASGSQTVTAAELGYTNAPFNNQFAISLDATTCGSGASAVATVGAGPATSFTVTAKNTGFCKAHVTETGAAYPLTGHGTHDGTFWISVTSASFSVQ